MKSLELVETITTIIISIGTIIGFIFTILGLKSNDKKITNLESEVRNALERKRTLDDAIDYIPKIDHYRRLLNKSSRFTDIENEALNSELKSLITELTTKYPELPKKEAITRFSSDTDFNDAFFKSQYLSFLVTTWDFFKYN